VDITSYSDLSTYCDDLTQTIFDMLIELLTEEQLLSMQFLMNTTHLLYNLTPGQSYGVICLARSKLGLKYSYQSLLAQIKATGYSYQSLPPKIQALGDSCSSILDKVKRLGYVDEALPMEINLKIIDYLLLDERHVNKSLDQRYKPRLGDTPERAEKISKMQKLMVQSITNTL